LPAFPKAVDALDKRSNIDIGSTDVGVVQDEDNVATIIATLPLQLSPAGCVFNETQLRSSIDLASFNLPTIIELCSDYIPINASTTHGILVHRKSLRIYCNISSVNSNKCIIDAQQASRLFDVWKSNISFHDITFVNGDAKKDTMYPQGGALYVSSSTIEMVHCNFLNNTARLGGGMILFHSSLTLRTHSSSNETFLPIIVQNNRASANGGFIEAYHSIVSIGQYHFKNNSAKFGGVFMITNTSLTLLGSSDPQRLMTFENNMADDSGGLILARDSSSLTTSNGSFLFQNNVATNSGGTIVAIHSFIELLNCHVVHNSARYGGGVLLFDSKLTLGTSSDNLSHNVKIQNNMASANGGFVDAYNSSIMIDGYHFRNNSAFDGGGFSITNTSLTLLDSNSDRMVPILFEDNVATRLGGVIYARDNSLITTKNGSFMFRNNMAHENGGAFYANDSTIEIVNCNFRSNKARDGGAMILFSSCLTLRKTSDHPTSTVFLQNNSASNMGGFMVAINSTITIDHPDPSNNSISPGYVLLGNNTAVASGGAIAAFDCVLEFYNCHVENNRASSGGSMFVVNSTVTLNKSYAPTFPIVFRNNEAEMVRTFIYFCRFQTSKTKFTNSFVLHWLILLECNLKFWYRKLIFLQLLSYSLEEHYI
jgi:predicted outer membrane repeat protein